MKKIEAHNQTNSTYKLGINQFSDLTWREFQEDYLAQSIENPSFTTEGPKLIDVEPIDWREKNIVTPVKNQGACGSCWAFSATGSFESYHALKDGELPSISEQELIDCSSSYGNKGCGGGFVSQSFDYIKDFQIATESDYPYKAKTQSCQRQEEGDRYKIEEYTSLKNPTLENLYAFLKKGPVSVVIEANSDFQSYQSGVYAFKESCGQKLNHAVLLVGQKENYFIVKNSWGTSWGENGYIKMEIGTGSGNCGIANKWDVIPGQI